MVSADSGLVLGDCISHLLSSDAAIEVVLVDNASTDEEPHKVMANHADDARLRFFDNADTIGFGPACNRGAVIANGDVLLFVNPDCVLEPGSIARLRATLGQSPEIGIVGADIRNADGSPTMASRRRDPTLRRALATLSGLARLEARVPAFAGVAMRGSRPSGPERVDAISGACFMIRRDVFDQVGGFDERYFLHFEDLDLCRRVRDAGFKVLLDPSVHVRHWQGSSSHHRAMFVARHKHAGMWRWFNRFDPAARSPVLRGLVWLGIRAHLAWFRLKRLFASD
ncbi:MAG: glycosyltransferase family 2 protein [Dokdonella sp.]